MNRTVILIAMFVLAACVAETRSTSVSEAGLQGEGQVLEFIRRF